MHTVQVNQNPITNQFIEDRKEKDCIMTFNTKKGIFPSSFKLLCVYLFFICAHEAIRCAVAATVIAFP